MRLVWGLLLMGVLVLSVLGIIFGNDVQKKFGIHPLQVGEPKQEAVDRPLIDATPVALDVEAETNSVQDQASRRQHTSRDDVRSDRHVASEQLVMAADHAIESARYEHAVKLLKQVLATTNGTGQSRTHCKLGACYESLELDQAALRHYQLANENSHREPVTTFALLGQCRIWTKTGRATEAQQTLYRELLQQDSNRSEQLTSRLQYELAISIYHTLFEEQREKQKKSVTGIELPRREVRAEQIVQELEKPIPNRKQNDTPEQMVKLEQHTDSIFFSSISKSESTLEFITRLCNEADFGLEIKSKLAEQLASHQLPYRCEHLPLSIILDALLTPQSLTWQQKGSILTISSKTQNAIPSSEPLVRVLKLSLTQAPDHHLAPYAQLVLAGLQQQDGNWLSAIRDYEGFVQRYPNSEFLSHVWFNIGVCRLAARQGEAAEAFHRCVDYGHHDRLSAAALSFLGRIYLMDDTPELAVHPLLKAETMATSQTQRREVQLLLAAACYLAERFEDESRVLQRMRRGQFTQEVSAQYSLLEELLLHAQQSKQAFRQYNPHTLLSAAMKVSSIADAESQRMNHLPVLQFEAFRILGLVDESQRIADKFIRANPQSGLANKLRQSIQKSSVVRDHQSRSPPVNSVANLNKHAETSAAYWRTKLQSQSLSLNERRIALKRLGAIYQKLGKHDLAIRLYTGDLTLVD